MFQPILQMNGTNSEPIFLRELVWELVAAVAAVPVPLAGGIVILCAVKEHADAMYLVYKGNVVAGVLHLGA